MECNALAAGASSSVVFVVLNCAMNLYMKWLFSPTGGNFSLPWTMLAVQQLEAYLILQPVLALTDTTGRLGWGVGRPKRELSSTEADEGLGAKELCQVFAMTCLFCLNVGLNSLSLVRISITLNQTARAFLPVGVLLLATCLEGRTYPVHSYATTLLLVGGIVLTCWGSPGFELCGFGLALASTFVAALGSSLNGRLLSSDAFKGTGSDRIMRLLMLQAVPAFFVFAAIALVVEGAELRTIVQESDWSVLLGLVSISSLLALIANLGRCFLVAATSALMETFAGNAKVALLCIIDNLVFGTMLNSYNYVGVVLTLAGFSMHVLLQYSRDEVAKDVLEDELISDAAAGQDSLPSGPGGSMESLDSVLAAADAEAAKAASRARWQRGLQLALLESAADTGLAAEHVALRLGRGVLADQEQQLALAKQQQSGPQEAGLQAIAEPQAPPSDDHQLAAVEDGKGSALEALWSCCGRARQRKLAHLEKVVARPLLRTYSAKLTRLGSKLTGLDVTPVLVVPGWLTKASQPDGAASGPSSGSQPARTQSYQQLQASASW